MPAQGEFEAEPADSDTLQRWPPWSAPLIVGVVAAATFATALWGDFVWDDRVFLPPGPRLLAVSSPLEFFRKGIWAFSNVAGFESVPIHRPIAALLLWALAPVFGAHPAAWHLLSAALHAGNSALVYSLARRLDPARPRIAALSGALIFAVLPCHVEAIAWIMAYPHPLATLFALGAAHAGLRQARGGGSAWLALAALMAVASALTFEGGIVVAPVVLTMVWLERRSPPPWPAWVGCGVAAALPLLLRARAIGDVVPLQLGGAAALRAIDFAASYLRELVSPVASGPYASYPQGGIAGPGTWMIAVALLGGSIWLLRWAAPSRRSQVWTAIVWAGTGLVLPIIAAMNAKPFFAPRALYLPSVGLALLVAALVPTEGRRRAHLRVILAAACLAGLVVGNVASAGWRDDRVVCERMVRAVPEDSATRRKLAHLLQAEGRLAEAEAQFREAARTGATPADRFDALEGLAALVGAGGRVDEAFRIYSEIVSAAPERAVSWIGLGNVAFLRGDPALAASDYRRALAAAPRNGEAAHNLSLALKALGDLDGAARASALAREIGAVGR